MRCDRNARRHDHRCRPPKCKQHQSCEEPSERTNPGPTCHLIHLFRIAMPAGIGPGAITGRGMQPGRRHTDVTRSRYPPIIGPQDLVLDRRRALLDRLGDQPEKVPLAVTYESVLFRCSCRAEPVVLVLEHDVWLCMHLDSPRP